MSVRRRSARCRRETTVLDGRAAAERRRRPADDRRRGRGRRSLHARCARQPARGDDRRRARERRADAPPRTRDSQLSLLQLAAASCTTTSSAPNGCAQLVAVLWPALRQHILLTAVAVALGFLIAAALALLAHRHGWIERPTIVLTTILYTIPSLALFELLVAPVGADVIAGGDRARLLHAADPVSQHRHRSARGARRRARRRRGDGHVPPAGPAARRAAARAARDRCRPADRHRHDHRARHDRRRVCNQGLGVPIHTAIGEGPFKTELIAAGGLAIALALARRRAARRRAAAAHPVGAGGALRERRALTSSSKPSSSSAATAPSPAIRSCRACAPHARDAQGRRDRGRHLARHRAAAGDLARPRPSRLLPRDQRSATSVARCRVSRYSRSVTPSSGSGCPSSSSRS